MERRIVPAFNLTIDGDVTSSSNIAADTTTLPGTTIFSPTASGAVLDVDDIEAALTSGNVLVTTGPGGGEAGDINWLETGIVDDLDYAGAEVRTLTFRSDAMSTSGNFTTQHISFNFSGNVDLVIDTTAPTPDGEIRLINDTAINSARNVTLRSGTKWTWIDSYYTLSASDDVNLYASAIVSGSNGAAIQSQDGNVTINAIIDLEIGSLTARADNGTIELNGFTTGDHDIWLSAKDMDIAADIGAGIPAGRVTFARGNVQYGAHTINAAGIRVGDFNLSDGVFAYLEGTGRLTGAVSVAYDGNLAPGGVGTVGQMTIDGDLTFYGGGYSVDLGTTSDEILLIGSGNVDLTNGGILGGVGSTGQLSSSGDVKLIDFPGLLSGAFWNAPSEGSKLAIGFDGVQLTHYGPAATGVTIARLPAAVGGAVSGAEYDGTRFTAKLTGGGELVGFLNGAGFLELIARGTGAASKLIVATRADASDDIVHLSTVRVAGRLRSFSAPRADLSGNFTATGTVGALTLGRVNGQVTIGGSSTDRTTVKAESFSSAAIPGTQLSTPGILSSLTTSGSFVGAVTAASIGAVKIGATLTGAGAGGNLSWNVAGGITSITAAEIQSFTLNARNLGTLTATGSVALRLPGNINFSTFNLFGNDGKIAMNGLKVLKAVGTVEGSNFNVHDGNVGAVTVGRFWNSNLYLNYTPSGAFDTGGSFDSTAHLTLKKFATTASMIGDPTNLLNWAYAGSQIAADAIGMIRLSGLRTANASAAFGIKFRTDGGSVQIKTAGPDAIGLNTNLAPGGTALAGDFYYLVV